VFDWLASRSDNAVGLVRAVDFLEFRVLAPDGIVATLTPSTNGKGTFCDPTRVFY